MQYRLQCSEPRIFWNYSRAAAAASDLESELPTSGDQDLTEPAEGNLSVDDDWHTLPFSGQSTRPPSEPAEPLERSTSLTFPPCGQLPLPAAEESNDKTLPDLWVAPYSQQVENYIVSDTSCTQISFSECPYICVVQVRGIDTWFHSYYPFHLGTAVIVQQIDEYVPLGLARGFHIGVVTETISFSPWIHPEDVWQQTCGLTVLGRANSRAFRQWTYICQTQDAISKKLFPPSSDECPMHKIECSLDGTRWTIAVEPSFNTFAIYRRAQEEFPGFQFRIVTLGV
jgi:hypothetical protein